MKPDPDVWPELVYRFVEHYRWEPQHLGPDTSAFHRKIRSQEVPLNFLFNLLLHALPEELRSSVVSPGATLPGGGPLRVLVPHPVSFTQPDVHLESAGSRVFVELKVHARTDLEQAQKYGLLLAKLAERDQEPKHPMLVYITGRELRRHWSPPRSAPGNESELVERLLAAPLSKKLLHNRAARALEAPYRTVLRSLTVRFATWQQVGERLGEVVSHTPVVAQGFIDGFLQDLSRRGLWKAGV